jgi:hypothetical protein
MLILNQALNIQFDFHVDQSNEIKEPAKRMKPKNASALGKKVYSI